MLDKVKIYLFIFFIIFLNFFFLIQKNESKNSNVMRKKIYLYFAIKVEKIGNVEDRFLDTQLDSVFIPKLMNDSNLLRSNDLKRVKFYLFYFIFIFYFLFFYFLFFLLLFYFIFFIFFIFFI